MSRLPSEPVAAPVAPPRTDMDRVLVRGIAWTGAAKYLTQVLRWAATLLVVRLLTPADYGIFSMASFFLGLVSHLTEFGVGTAVLTLRDLDEEDIAQLNGTAVLFGVAACLLTCAMAEPLALFYRAPELTAVVAVLSLGFLVRSFRSVPIALLQKDLRFKLFAFFEAIDAVILSILMVVFALGGLGYWTLVLGDLCSGFLGTVLMLSQRRARFAWPRIARIRRALTFSWHIVVSRMSWYWYSNADYMVAGRFLGKGALGVYSLAFELSRLPVEKITALVGRVTPAFFAAAQDDDAALRRYLLNITEGLAVFTFPLCWGLALVANAFVPSVLGEEWTGAVVPLQLLATYAAWLSTTALFPQILVVKGDARLNARVSVLCALVLPVAFFVGQRLWGTTGLAVAWVVVHPLLSLPVYERALKHIGLPLRRYLAALWPAFSASFAMMCAVLLVRFAFPRVSETVHLATEIAAGGVAYVLTILVCFRERVALFKQSLQALRKA